MLITSDGSQFGMISGGCLESEILRKASWLTSSGVPVLRHYDAQLNEEAVWQFGLGCDGTVDVLLEKLEPEVEPEYLRALQSWLQAGAAGVLATVISSSIEGLIVGDRFRWAPHVKETQNLFPALQARLPQDMQSTFNQGRSRIIHYSSPTGRATFLFEMICPPPRITVFGSGPDIIPLVTIAKLIGWVVVVANPTRKAYSLPQSVVVDRYVRGNVDECLRSLLPTQSSACVLMTHNYLIDRAILGSLLKSNPKYIGILGPRTRTEQMLDDLGLKKCFYSSTSCHLHYPAGLDIGSETPEQIAIAIVSEIQAAFANRSAGKLGDRKGPIHDELLEEELSITIGP
jgi:xanthine/CO dehydrogenase XdhC/CoxF family maturation factor